MRLQLFLSDSPKPVLISSTAARINPWRGTSGANGLLHMTIGRIVG